MISLFKAVSGFPNSANTDNDADILVPHTSILWIEKSGQEGCSTIAFANPRAGSMTVRGTPTELYEQMRKDSFPPFTEYNVTNQVGELISSETYRVGKDDNPPDHHPV